MDLTLKVTESKTSATCNKASRTSRKVQGLIVFCGEVKLQEENFFPVLTTI